MRKRSIIMFFIWSILMLADELTLEKLEILKEKKMITKEEYTLLKSELTKTKEELIYTLKINGTEVDKFYSVINDRGENYFELTSFFKAIGLEDYLEKNKIKLLLGETLRKVEIDLKNGKVYNKGKEIATNAILKQGDKIYLKQKVFATLFTLDLRVNNETSKISVALNFSPPKELFKRLDLRAVALKNQVADGELRYVSERKLFETGYMRVQVDGTLGKAKNEKKYKQDWGASIEYQGGLLYGEFQLGYDIKAEKLTTLQLEYNDIWRYHTLQIYGTAVGEPKGSWGVKFFKDTGYEIDGKTVIIRERVPIGSRAELRYMGTSIAIENEENGLVVFDNPLITTDRTYTLVIFTPDGKIYEKTIKTTEDFNLQNKGEFKYDININQDGETGKYIGNFNVFYGLTNSLTLGAGFVRGIENINGKYEYVHDLNADITYGATYNGLSYVLSLKGTKGFDNYKTSDKSFEDRYQYGGLVQLGYWKLRYTYERNEMGSYFDTKNNEGHEVQFNITDYMRMTYDYSKLTKYNGNIEEDMSLDLSIDKSIGKILFSANYNRQFYGDNKGDEYSISAFYTTKTNISTKLEAKWTNSGRDYETIFTLYNNNYRGFLDYNFEAGYSNRYKEKFAVNLNFKIADWLEFDTTFDKYGAERYTVGIDKIVDLRNPSLDIDSMDISRVKVLTFVDENNNNKYDDFEKVVEGVDVTLGKQTLTTDENGREIFYGVSNGLVHNLKLAIKKPSFTLGENKITVKGDFASTIEAQIPIKPMVNLNGQIHIGKELKLTKLQKEALFQDLLIEIKDMNGKSIELTTPDDTGAFDVSGLYPDRYRVEVTYLGTDYNLKKISEVLKLTYLDNIFENKVSFKITDKSISLLSINEDLEELQDKLTKLEQEDKYSIIERNTVEPEKLEEKKKYSESKKEIKYSSTGRKYTVVSKGNRYSLIGKNKYTVVSKNNKYSLAGKSSEKVSMLKK